MSIQLRHPEVLEALRSLNAARIATEEVIRKEEEACAAYQAALRSARDQPCPFGEEGAHEYKPGFAGYRGECQHCGINGGKA